MMGIFAESSIKLLQLYYILLLIFECLGRVEVFFWSIVDLLAFVVSHPTALLKWH